MNHSDNNIIGAVDAILLKTNFTTMLMKTSFKKIGGPTLIGTGNLYSKTTSRILRNFRFNYAIHFFNCQ